MLPRRRMAFSHVIYTSGVFFLTVAFALIAVVALYANHGSPFCEPTPSGAERIVSCKLIHVLRKRAESETLSKSDGARADGAL